MVPDEAADNLKCAGSFRVGASGSGHSETNGEALDWCLSSADCLGLGRNSLGNSDGTTVEGGMEREHVGGTWVTFCDKPLSHPSNLGQTASRWRAWKKIADPNYIPPPPPPAPAPAPAAPAAASVCPDTTGATGLCQRTIYCSCSLCGAGRRQELMTRRLRRRLLISTAMAPSTLTTCCSCLPASGRRARSRHCYDHTVLGLDIIDS
jgi:hypothetical protein